MAAQQNLCTPIRFSPSKPFTEASSLLSAKKTQAFTSNKHVATLLCLPAPMRHQWTKGFSPKKSLQHLTMSSHLFISPTHPYCLPMAMWPINHQISDIQRLHGFSSMLWSPTSRWPSSGVCLNESVVWERALPEMTWNASSLVDTKCCEVYLMEEWYTFTAHQIQIQRINIWRNYTSAFKRKCQKKMLTNKTNALESCWILSSYWLRMVITKQVFWCLFVYFQRSVPFTSAQHAESFWPMASVGSLGTRPWESARYPAVATSKAKNGLMYLAGVTQITL